jgi:hypothetical protein
MRVDSTLPANALLEPGVNLPTRLAAPALPIPAPGPFAALAGREVWPDLSAAVTADFANKLLLNVGQPDFVRPLFGAHSDVMSAFVIGTEYDYSHNA